MPSPAPRGWPERVIAAATIGGVAPLYLAGEARRGSSGMGAENTREFGAAMAGVGWGSRVAYLEPEAALELRIVTPDGGWADAFGDLIDDVDRGAHTGAFS